ncbi:MAG: hypothetical protein F4134_13470 [Acidimicrobiaceae bacterium]|nr:hypothetical protein [Acidimicrobiaceae bacterium]
MRLPSWARAVPLVLVATAVLAAGCGRSGYEYVENDDETVFVKIPEDWQVVSEGAVNFTIAPDDDIQPIYGEFVWPWRAEFDAAPSGLAGSFDHVQGYVEVQPVDRRMQAQVRPDLFFPELTVDPGLVEQVRHDLVTIGDVSGHRMAWKQVAADGETFVSDRLVLIDSLGSKVYHLHVVCTLGCYNANLAEINEVMRTFTVED